MKKKNPRHQKPRVKKGGKARISKMKFVDVAGNIKVQRVRQMRRDELWKPLKGVVPTVKQAIKHLHPQYVPLNSAEGRRRLKAADQAIGKHLSVMRSRKFSRNGGILLCPSEVKHE